MALEYVLKVSITSSVFFGILLLAGITVIQFYRGRRRNLEILEKSIRVLEEVIKPKSKEYTVVGIYVGYHAKYLVDRSGVREVNATVVLLPRQSLLYIPIAIMTSRFDRLYLVFQLRKAPYAEAHLVRKGYYRLGVRRVIKNFENMVCESVEIGGVKYYLLYTSRSMAEKLLKFANELSRPSILNHVAIVPKLNRVYISAKLDLDVLRELTAKSYTLAREVA